MKVLHFWLVLLFFTWIGAVPLIEKQVSRKGFHFKGLESRIFKGQLANPGQFPWQAGIFNGSFTRENYLCGGSIIDKRWILTACHCVTDPLGVTPVVFLGSTSLLGDPTHSRKEFSKVKIYVHPDAYIPKLINGMSVGEPSRNDIALIKLLDHVTFDDDDNNTRVIKLADEELPLHDVQVVASGWGSTEYGGDSENLLFANLTTVTNNKRCNPPPGYLCAEGTQQTCHGDSGSPLVYYNQTTRTHFLVGVTSFNTNTDQEDVEDEMTCKENVSGQVFDFFLNVYKYKGWIEATIINNSN